MHKLRILLLILVGILIMIVSGWRAAIHIKREFHIYSDSSDAVLSNWYYDTLYWDTEGIGFTKHDAKQKYGYEGEFDDTTSTFRIEPSGKNVREVPIAEPGRDFFQSFNILRDLDIEPIHGAYLSPNGQQILFLQPVDDANERFLKSVLVIHRDGTNFRRLISQIKFAQNFSWSPDNQRVAFIHQTRSFLDDTLIILDIESGQQAEIYPDISKPLTEANWSPDSQKIAFVADGNIYSAHVEVASPIITKLTTPDDHIRSLAWSPNSKQIVFSTDQFTEWGVRSPQLHILDIETRSSATIYREFGSDARVSMLEDYFWLLCFSVWGLFAALAFYLSKKELRSR